MANLRTGFCIVLLSLLLASLAAAEVKIRVGPDGRKVISNESPAQSARRSSSRLMPVPDPDLEPLIERHSQDHELDPKLVRAVIQAESGYNRRALSNKGAMGLMQLMPATASSLRVRDPWDASENLRGGTLYLRQLMDRFAGRLELAVAAYNAGPGAVERHGGIPPYRETREYVRRVLALYHGTEVPLPRTSLASATRRSAAAPPAAMVAGKRKPRITRNAENQIVITTALE